MVALADVPVSEFMTANPYGVVVEENLATVVRVMDEQHFHHVVVYDCGEVVGLLSRHDIDVVAAVPGTNLSVVKASATMIKRPICVGPQTSVSKAASKMRKYGVGSLLVTADVDKVPLGIFTLSDLLRVVADGN